jgi:uncharacterized protein (DUF2132 family)
MSEQQPNNPMHGITLEQVVNSLVDHYGWSKLGKCINIRCFNSNPSVNSSLKFLRKTPWARKKVEGLYIDTIGNEGLRVIDRLDKTG